jgi:hypothetical protein
MRNLILKNVCTAWILGMGSPAAYAGPLSMGIPDTFGSLLHVSPGQMPLMTTSNRLDFRGKMDQTDIKLDRAGTNLNVDVDLQSLAISDIWRYQSWSVGLGLERQWQKISDSIADSDDETYVVTTLSPMIAYSFDELLRLGLSYDHDKVVGSEDYTFGRPAIGLGATLGRLDFDLGYKPEVFETDDDDNVLVYWAAKVSAKIGGKVAEDWYLGFGADFHDFNRKISDRLNVYDMKLDTEDKLGLNVVAEYRLHPTWSATVAMLRIPRTVDAERVQATNETGGELGLSFADESLSAGLSAAYLTGKANYKVEGVDYVYKDKRVTAQAWGAMTL